MLDPPREAGFRDYITACRESRSKYEVYTATYENPMSKSQLKSFRRMIRSPRMLKVQCCGRAIIAPRV